MEAAAPRGAAVVQASASEGGVATPTSTSTSTTYRQRRQEAVAASGHRLRHPSLARFLPEHVTPSLRRLLQPRDEGAPRGEEDDGRLWAEGVELRHQWRDLHSLCLFSDAFSRKLIEEVEHYLQSSAPKTSEIVLEEIGMEACMAELAERVLRPIAAQLYPDLTVPLTHHHSFIIKNASWESDSFQLWKYVDEQSGEPTSRHVDDSAVTFNMCLQGAGRFDGCELRFYGDKRDPRYRLDRYFEHQQEPGVGTVHLGDNEHEVLSMTSIDTCRYNLIIWLSPS